jgi:hypothetical protein
VSDPTRPPACRRHAARLGVTPERWNPRYLAYCVWIGLTPAEERARGETMGPYIAWIAGHTARWREQAGQGPEAPLEPEFDAWLWAEVDRALEVP